MDRRPPLPPSSGPAKPPLPRTSTSAAGSTTQQPQSDAAPGADEVANGDNGAASSATRATQSARTLSMQERIQSLKRKLNQVAVDVPLEVKRLQWQAEINMLREQPHSPMFLWCVQRKYERGAMCSYYEGYRTQSEIVVCLSCVRNNPSKKVFGVCYECYKSCHYGHGPVLILYTLRHFRCDCGTARSGCECILKMPTECFRHNADVDIFAREKEEYARVRRSNNDGNVYGLSFFNRMCYCRETLEPEGKQGTTTPSSSSSSATSAAATSTSSSTVLNTTSGSALSEEGEEIGGADALARALVSDGDAASGTDHTAPPVVVSTMSPASVAAAAPSPPGVLILCLRCNDWFHRTEKCMPTEECVYVGEGPYSFLCKRCVAGCTWLHPYIRYYTRHLTRVLTQGQAGSSWSPFFAFHTPVPTATVTAAAAVAEIDPTAVAPSSPPQDQENAQDTGTRPAAPCHRPVFLPINEQEASDDAAWAPPACNVFANWPALLCPCPTCVRTMLDRHLMFFWDPDVNVDLGRDDGNDEEQNGQQEDGEEESDGIEDVANDTDDTPFHDEDDHSHDHDDYDYDDDFYVDEVEEDMYISMPNTADDHDEDDGDEMGTEEEGEESENDGEGDEGDEGEDGDDQWEQDEDDAGVDDDDDDGEGEEEEVDEAMWRRCPDYPGESPSPDHHRLEHGGQDHAHDLFVVNGHRRPAVAGHAEHDASLGVVTPGPTRLPPSHSSTCLEHLERFLAPLDPVPAATTRSQRRRDAGGNDDTNNTMTHGVADHPATTVLAGTTETDPWTPVAARHPLWNALPRHLRRCIISLWLADIEEVVDRVLRNKPEGERHLITVDDVTEMRRQLQDLRDRRRRPPPDHRDSSTTP